MVNEHHSVIAAEVTIDSPDFGHLEPMIAAAERELEAIGVTERPQVALADAGYWHQVQMQNIAARGIQVLVPPDASSEPIRVPAGAGCSKASSGVSSIADANRSSSRYSLTRS